jgi:transposase
MTEPGRFAGSDGGRRPKRFLSPSQKYEIWIGLLRSEYSAAEAADRAGG